MRMVVFTAVIGQTEALQSPWVIGRNVRYLCFSDQPVQVPPYEWVPVEAGDDTPRRASRRVKILQAHPILQSADLTLWHDASYRLTRDPHWAVKRLAAADIVAMRHPRRATIELEALAIARYGYVTVDQAEANVARYRAEGFDGGLTSAGLLGRHRSDRIDAFNALWWQESQDQWGGRDQGSIDYAAWKTGASITYIPGTVKANQYAAFRPIREARPT